jgi:hypothetical protein
VCAIRSFHCVISWLSTTEGYLLVVLKSYFDGGNQADSTQYDVLSLAVISGTPELWPPLERGWKKVLKKHKVDYLHTTDAVARKGIYTGWTESRRDAFLKDCVKIAERHVARANIPGRAVGKYGLFSVVISFVLKDFVKQAKDVPGTPNNANESCFRQALGEVLLWSANQASCEDIHLFFDQGEPFYGHLCQLLNSKQAMKDAFLLQKISHRSESDMRRVPALQLADLYAWCVSHRLSEWKPRWQVRMLKTHWLGQWFDKTNIHDIKWDEQAKFSTWNLPKRKPTK